jgi:hypothetical protein
LKKRRRKPAGIMTTPIQNFYSILIHIPPSQARPGRLENYNKYTKIHLRLSSRKKRTLISVMEKGES